MAEAEQDQQDTQEEMVNEPRLREVTAKNYTGREKVVGVTTEGTLRTKKDGGVAGEVLPEVREGEVYETLNPVSGANYRRVKVLRVEGDHAVMQNIHTYVESQIRLDRLVPEHGWRRYAS